MYVRAILYRSDSMSTIRTRMRPVDASMMLANGIGLKCPS